MSQARRERGGEESWVVMGKSLGFVYGVPGGILVGALVGAFFEVVHLPHPAAWGVLIGIGSGLLIGGAAGKRAARGDYKWVRRELTLAPNTEWDALVKALNVKAADEHHLLLRREADYVAYSPTLVTPVAGGPLTVSGQYLSVVVARLNATTVAITGPQRMADALKTAAIEAGVIAAEVSGVDNAGGGNVERQGP